MNTTNNDDNNDNNNTTPEIGPIKLVAMDPPAPHLRSNSYDENQTEHRSLQVQNGKLNAEIWLLTHQRASSKKDDPTAFAATIASMREQLKENQTRMRTLLFLINRAKLERTIRPAPLTRAVSGWYT